MVFLDTNTCIYFLNGRSERIRDKLLATPPKDIGIPALVKAELIFGAYKSQTPDKTLEKIERFLSAFQIIPFSDPAT